MTTPKQEIEAAQKTISELKDYKSRNWAIGLNGDTLEPDGFVVFFGVRELAFNFYVRSQGVSLGDSSAYDKNIATLEQYVETIRDKEVSTSNSQINELQDYKARNWAIGLNGDTFNPDGFLKFFKERELPFRFYVQNKGVSIGNSSAYDENITTLNNYIMSLKG